jgi:hypothetical protein
MIEKHLRFMPCVLSLLVICVGGAPAKSADCTQLNNLMSITDLKTLATGPLEAKPKEQSKIAPAKVVLKGVGTQCVVRITARQGYECMRPFNETRDKELVRAVKTFAASWRPCLAGWNEDYLAELKYTGFVGITFTKGDKKLVFHTLGGEMVFAFSDHIPN